MCGVHRKNLAYRRHDKFVFVCKIQAVEAIDELRTIGHRHFFGVAIENVQGHSTEHGVSQGGHLLKNIARCGL